MRVLPVGTLNLAVRGAAGVAAHRRQDGHREGGGLGEGSGPLRPRPTGRLPSLYDHAQDFPEGAHVYGNRERRHHRVQRISLGAHRVIKRHQKAVAAGSAQESRKTI